MRINEMSLAMRLIIVVGLSSAGLLVLLLLMQIVVLFDITALEEIWVLKVFQMLQSIVVFGLPALIYAYFCSNQTFRYLDIKRVKNSNSWWLTLVCMLAVFPVVNLLVRWNEQLQLPNFLESIETWMRVQEYSAQALIEQFMNVQTFGGLLFNILVMAIAPAICEEMLFRGVIQKIFAEKMGIHWGIWITGFIFSVIHVQFFGFIPRFLLGVLFGYLLLYSRSLWIPILAHFIHNSLAIMSYYLQQKYHWEFDLESIGSGNTWWISIIGGILFLMTFWTLRTQNNKILRRE